MTSEDKALFNLGRLLGAIDFFLEECEYFKHSKSVDMSGYHGVSIQVPQGIKGELWHRSLNNLNAIREEIRKEYKYKT